MQEELEECRIMKWVCRALSTQGFLSYCLSQYAYKNPCKRRVFVSQPVTLLVAKMSSCWLALLGIQCIWLKIRMLCLPYKNEIPIVFSYSMYLMHARYFKFTVNQWKMFTKHYRIDPVRTTQQGTVLTRWAEYSTRPTSNNEMDIINGMTTEAQRPHLTSLRAYPVKYVFSFVWIFINIHIT